MFSSIMKALFGSKTERDVKSLVPIVEKINAEEAWLQLFQKKLF